MLYNYGQKTKTGFKRWMGGETQLGGVDVYRTYFQYPDYITDIKGFQGDHYSPFLPIDIDHKDLSEAFEIFKLYANTFKEARYYFSGAKGFHIEVPQAVFGYTAGPNLYREFKQYARSKLAGCDLAIYDISRLWRIPNTINSKTGLYKIQLGEADIKAGLDHILTKAKQPGELWDVKVTKQLPWVNQFKAYQQAFTGEVIPDGDRHNTVVSMIGYLLNKRVDTSVIVNIVDAMPLEDAEEFDREKIGKMVMSMSRRHGGQFAVNAKTGQILNTLSNYCLAITRSNYKLSFDSFQQTIALDGRSLKEVDVIRIRRNLEDNYGLSAKILVEDAVQLVAHDKASNALQEYLKGLKWDGIERAERLFVDTLGADNNDYVRRVTKINLVGAVMRAMKPGCKHDTMLVLVGGQGIGKSTLILKLANGWYATAPLKIDSKDAFIGLGGSWLIEFAEMATYSSRNADLNRLKEYLTKQADKYRAPYAKVDEEHPRHSIFIGSTNNPDFLRDSTGERRFHPVEVTKPNWDLVTQEYINQIWAEAYQWFLAGEKNYLLDGELGEEYASVIERHKEVNEQEGPILDFCSAKENEVFHMSKLLDFLGYKKEALGDRLITRRIGDILKRFNYRRVTRAVEGKQTKVWTRGD